MEMTKSGYKEVLSDYHTAHHSMGDVTYEVFLPDTCFECWKQANEAIESGRPVPERPDQEGIDDTTES